MSVDQATFRTVLGNFATGCTVVTLPGSPPHGMTANAFSSVSLDPPLCLVCVDHETRSYELLSGEDIEAFGVSILADHQQELAEHFAGMTELATDPFETEPTKAGTDDVPLFTESLAYLDCTINATYEAGDHTIYVGYAEDASVQSPEADPLTFFRGDWGTTTPLEE